MYRFITEDLIDQKVLKIPIPGMIAHFLYEDFHPNHKQDAEQTASEVISHLILRKTDTDDWNYNEDLKIKLSPQFCTETIIQNIKDFINSWSGIKIYLYHITSINFIGDLDFAIIDFEISYDATIANSSEILSSKANGQIRLENGFESWGIPCWQILECEFPGFRILINLCYPQVYKPGAQNDSKHNSPEYSTIFFIFIS